MSVTQPSPLEEVWVESPLAADEIPKTGSPGTSCAATSAALAHVQGNRSGHLIKSSPVSYPLSVRPRSAASPGARTGFVRNV